MRDELRATAIVIGDGQRCAAILALDLMYNDAGFTRKVRELVAAGTDVPPKAICVNFSHSHNAPTAGLILGVVVWAGAQLVTRWPDESLSGRDRIASPSSAPV